VSPALLRDCEGNLPAEAIQVLIENLQQLQELKADGESVIATLQSEIRQWHAGDNEDQDASSISATRNQAQTQQPPQLTSAFRSSRQAVITGSTNELQELLTSRLSRTNYATH